MGDFRNDLKYSLRMLFVNPAFTVTAVALLAVWLPATCASRLDPQQALCIE